MFKVKKRASKIGGPSFCSELPVYRQQMQLTQSMHACRQQRQSLLEAKAAAESDSSATPVAILASFDFMVFSKWN